MSQIMAIDADVIVNLWGNSNVDAVERDPWDAVADNITMPEMLAQWCAASRHGSHEGRARRQLRRPLPGPFRCAKHFTFLRRRVRDFFLFSIS